MILRLTELIEKAKQKPTRRVAVAAAEDEMVLKSLVAAMQQGVISPVLVGDKTAIEKTAKHAALDLSRVEIIHNPDGAVESAKIALSLVKRGDADILMKGLFLRATRLGGTDKANGLRKAALLSHVAFFEFLLPQTLCVMDVMNIARFRHQSTHSQQCRRVCRNSG